MKSMRNLLAITITIMFLFTACDENGYSYHDNTPPSPPGNVGTITGDNRVDIYWDHSYERDVAGYNVYYNYSYEGTYTLLGSTQDNYFVDYGARNGVKYFYAIAAYDENLNESELSYDEVFDTPRPEGFNQAVFDYSYSPNSSGYDFSEFLVTAFDSDGADFFFENYDGVFYLNVWDDTDIQDLGETNDIYDISYSPIDGWVPMYEGDNVKYVEVFPGHTYVIWTWDNHFAKVRVKRITSERMVFDWAYQLVEGERELKRSDNGRKPLPDAPVKNHRK